MKLYNSKQSAASPTRDEYEEARSLDVHPETFDRATYKRLRSSLSHDQIKDALTRHLGEGYIVPIEDLEAAMDNNNGNFEDALSEARSYSKNHLSRVLNAASTAIDASRPRSLQHEQLDQITSRLMLHHLISRNNVATLNPEHANYLGTAKNHEWLMNECVKLNPYLKSWMGLENDEEELPDGRSLRLSPRDYHDFIDRLYDHFQGQLFDIKSAARGDNPTFGINRERNAIDFRLAIATQRRLRALGNLASGQFGSDGFDNSWYEAE